MDMKIGAYVIDRSQRTGYRTVYAIRKIEGDRALVERIGEIVNGRMDYTTGHRDQSYRLLSDLAIHS